MPRHIYENQIEGAKEQIIRKPKSLPTVDVGKFSCIYDWNSGNAILNNYNPHPKINFGSIAV